MRTAMNTSQPLSPQKALERLAAACAKAECCESDVRRKLQLWNVDYACHDEIVDTLRSGGYIDDGRYCRAFVEDKWNFNRWGRQKIRMELRRRQLPDECIALALQTIDDDEYHTVLADILQRKAASTGKTDGWALRQKLMRYAAGRGYEPDVAIECIESILEE
jgi:regulatory protein